MKYAKVVMTCGVSGFGKTNAIRTWLDEKQLVEFKTSGASQNPELLAGETRVSTSKKVAKALEHLDVQAHISNPQRISAEYSALNSLKILGRLKEKPHVVLIHTDSLGGEIAATVLKYFLVKSFNAAVDLKSCCIRVDDREQLRHDLGNYMETVSKALMGGDENCRSYTAFCPLGGYKIMTSLGTLAAGLYGYPVLYLHEDKQILHEIPGIPWQIKREELEKLAPTLIRLGETTAEEDLDATDRANVEAFPWLFENTDGLRAVNAIGLFLMTQHPDLFSPVVTICKKARKEIENTSAEDTVNGQLRVLIRKLQSASADSDLQHERECKLRAHDGWHLYKGSSNGTMIFRAIYKWADRMLTVRKIWTDHDKYEKEMHSAWNQPLGETTEWTL